MSIGRLILALLLGASLPMGCHVVLGIEPPPEGNAVGGAGGGASDSSSTSGGVGMGGSGGSAGGGTGDCMVHECSVADAGFASGTPASVQIAESGATCKIMIVPGDVRFSSTSPCLLRGGANGNVDPTNPIEKKTDGGGFFLDNGLGLETPVTDNICIPFFCEGTQGKGVVFTHQDSNQTASQSHYQ